MLTSHQLQAIAMAWPTSESELLALQLRGISSNKLQVYSRAILGVLKDVEAFVQC